MILFRMLTDGTQIEARANEFMLKPQILLFKLVQGFLNILNVFIFKQGLDLVECEVHFEEGLFALLNRIKKHTLLLEGQCVTYADCLGAP